MSTQMKNLVCFLFVGFLIVLVTQRPTLAETPSAADIIEFRAPAPESVGTREREAGVEMVAPMGSPSIVKTNDGRLMMIGGGQARYSQDGGTTWTKAENLSANIKFAIRLANGKLAGPGADGHSYTSDDNGQTWSRGGSMTVGDVPASPYTTGGSATLIQTRSGRLVAPVRFISGAGHNGQYEFAGSYGTLNGKMMHIEGHAHWPEPDNAFVVYSDDEGQTWNRSEGGIMIWHHDGHGGMWPVDEPTLVETTDGDVVLFARTTLGRLYLCRSGTVDYINRQGNRIQLQPGQRFDHPKAASVAMSYSPCTVRRIPSTGHLLMIWNQISGDEIRAGYRRGRLSSAISTDEGKTWQNFRTVDRSVLPPIGRVEPDPKPVMARGLDYVGVLPEDYGGVSYPTLDVVDNTVFVFWSRGVVNRRPGDVVGRRMWVVPLSWFYEEEADLPKGPRLLVKVPAGDAAQWNTFEIPADFYDGRHYCRSDDLTTHLKSPLGRLGQNIYGPAHQVITCLGWKPQYDNSQMDNEEDPQLTVYCTHPLCDSPPVPGVAE